jgi:hypothetical protein
VRLLDHSIASGAFRAHSMFQAGVLKKVQDGVMKSPFTPKRIKDACAAAVAAGLV